MNKNKLNKKTFKSHRKNIKSGDLLIWTNNKGNRFVRLCSWLIRVATISEYNHVGIAWNLNGRLLMIHATVPRVEIVPIDPSLSKVDFYHIKMNVDWNKNLEDKILTDIGKPYGYLDAFLSLFGKEDRTNNKVHCGELVSKFYKYTGYELNCKSTPSMIVKKLLDDGHELICVNPK